MEQLGSQLEGKAEDVGVEKEEEEGGRPVVDVSGGSAAHGGVDNALGLVAEHVDAAVLLLVGALPPVRHFVPDHLPDVLDDHPGHLDVPLRVQPQPWTHLLFHLTHGT